MVTRSGTTPWRWKPHMLLAGAPEAWLYFIGDEEAAGGVDLVDRLREKAGRVRHDAVAGKNRVTNSAAGADSVRTHLLDAFTDVMAEFRRAIWPERGGNWHRPRAETRPVLGRHAGDNVGRTVISKVRNDKASPARDRFADADRQIVSLATGTRVDNIPDLTGKCRQQSFGQCQRLLRQVPRVSIQRACLAS